MDIDLDLGDDAKLSPSTCATDYYNLEANLTATHSTPNASVILVTVSFIMGGSGALVI